MLKSRNGEMTYASGGNGTILHLASEMFLEEAKAKARHIPYKGVGPMVTDLIGGQVQVIFDGLPASIEHIRAGRLRALALTTAARLETLPDIPTVAEFVPGYEASAVHGIGAPKNTPTEIVDRLNKEINAALADPKMGGRLTHLSFTVLPRSPADFGKLIAEETEKWGKVVKFSGARPD